MRPIRRRIPLDDALATISRPRAPIARDRARSARATPTDACSPAHDRRRGRRAAVRSRRDGRLRGESPRTPSAPAATIRGRCARSKRSSPARSSTATLSARRVHRDRHRRADAAGRRRGGDGRRNRTARRRPTSGSSRRSIRGSTSAGAAPTSRRRQPVLARGRRCSTRAASARSPRSASLDVEVYARPRVAILSTGNEIVEPGQPLGPGTDLRHQPLHAVGGHRRARRRRRCPCARPPDTLDELTAAIDAARGRRRPGLLRRQLGRRTRPDPRRAAGSGRGASFTASRSSPASRPRSAASTAQPVLGHAGLPDLVPVERLHPAGAAAAPHRAPARASRRDACALPLARRIVSTTGRHQFYTVRVADGAAVPAFKASGDITSMSHADGYIEIPAQTDIVEAGELVDVKLF